MNYRREMRIGLIKLKTDIENAAPELEAAYRGAMESAVNHAELCDLIGSLTNYEFGKDLGHLIERRMGSGYIGDFSKIEEMAMQAIVQALQLQCKCQLVNQSQEGGPE